MRGSGTRKLRSGAVLTLAALGFASLAFAQVDPFGGSNRNYDAREAARRGAVRAPERRGAVAGLVGVRGGS